MSRVSRLATTVLLSGGLCLAGLGLGAGIAHAEGPYQWCPGDDPRGFPGAFNSPAAQAVIRISAPGCELSVTTTVPLPVSNVVLA